MERVTVVPEKSYQPTITQRERFEKLRRFNWLYVYTPILICTAVVLVLIGMMMWGTFANPETPTRLFFSGMADLILILILLPLIVIGLIGPAALGGFVYWQIQSRRTRQEQPVQIEGNLVQRYSWRLEALLDKAAVTIERIVAKIATLLIRVHGQVEFASQFLRKIIDKPLQD